MRIRIAFIALFSAAFPFSGISQQVVESIAGIVGNEVIYLSDVEGQVLQRKAEKDPTPVDQLRCMVYEDLLVQKLFLDQARIDSVEVSPENVETDLNNRLSDYIRRAGSEQALENYFNKSMAEIRKDLREMLTNQYIIQETQGTIAQSITVTPEEIKKYYTSLPEDSLPLVPRKVELSIITVEPPDMEESKAEVRQRLLDIRSRIINGESFRTLAVLYSEDPGSAPNGGELGFMNKGELAKPYAEAAWSLKKDGVSKIVETEFGFHIIQMIDRKGDMVNTRHILMKPKVTVEAREKANNALDSLANMIRRNELKFDEAAGIFSSDKNSKNNAGIVINPESMSSKFSVEDLDPDVSKVITKMNINEISLPFQSTDRESQQMVYKIIKLVKKIDAHKADLQNDYQKLSEIYLVHKKEQTFNDWVKAQQMKNYIRIDDTYANCNFNFTQWIK